MKASFGLPSCTYNITLSRDELKRLLETGLITVHPYKVPCTTSRLVWNSDKNNFTTMDRKTINNNLRFLLDEPVADIEDLDWHVQFLTITLEKEPKKKKHPCVNCTDGWGLTTTEGIETCHDSCGRLADYISGKEAPNAD